MTNNLLPFQNTVLMFQSIPKPPIPSLKKKFEKCWSNSPLCYQFRRSNAPRVGASKRVKSPTSGIVSTNYASSHVKATVQNFFPMRKTVYSNVHIL